MTSPFLDDAFLNNVFAECPQCGHKDFSGPSELKAHDILICAGCGGRLSLEDAVAAGIEKALVQELTKDGTFKR